MIKQIIRLVRYWGIHNLATKAYEKIVIDGRRFKKVGQDMPDFNAQELFEEGKQLQILEPNQTIFYLTHQYYPNHQGGTEQFVRNLALGMKQQGHRPIVVTLDYEECKVYPHQLGGILYRFYEIDGVQVIAFRYVHTPRGMLYKHIDQANPELYRFATFLLSEYQPQLVHCAYPQPMASFLKCCNDRGILYCVTLTDFNIACHYAIKIDKKGHFCTDSEAGKRCRKVCSTCMIKDTKKRYRDAKELLMHAQYVTVPSQFAANVIHQEFDRVHPVVIPHGIEENDLQYTQDNRQPGSYAYVGKLTTLKGVHLLVEAFKEAAMSNATLTIYGDGPAAYKKKLQQLIGHTTSIKLSGSVPHQDITKIYEQHAVVVVPSLCYETYNYVVREASQAGCFVIGADVGGIPEAIVDGETGLLFRAGNQQSLSTQLKHAYEKYPLYKMEYATIQEEVARYATLYSRVISK